MNKSGQAAMEFLATYSWAFLIILVMIGALAYFGIFSPQTTIGDRCMAPPGFTCTNYQINTDSQKIKLLNQRLETINIINDTIFLKEKDSQTTCTLTNYNNLLTDTSLEFICSGNSQDLNLQEGEKVKLELAFKYYKRDSGITFNRPINVQLITSVLGPN